MQEGAGPNNKGDGKIMPTFIVSLKGDITALIEAEDEFEARSKLRAELPSDFKVRDGWCEQEKP